MGRPDAREKNTTQEKTVLFVCTGNTCRSPMAEWIFLHLFRDEPLFSEAGKPVDLRAASAGIAARPGETASPFSETALLRLFGISTGGHTSQRITRDLLASADLVLCMTQKHKIILRQSFPEFANTIFSLSDPVSDSKKKGIPGTDVTDPFGGGEEMYLLIAEMIRDRLVELWPGVKRFLGIHEKKE